MTDLKDKLSKKRADAQAKFDKLEAERKQLVSQRADFDRAIAIKMEELVRLQGEFRVLEDLLKDKSEKKE
jgi:predicted transcriptional regulator